jgi:hypothetical protein
MADKRISQLVDRGTVANSDVVPIVVSGASTTNKATISSIQTFMQGNLDLGVTSVGLSMPSAFTVTGSPVTSSGNISVVGAGTVAQYIRGDGSLADFPQGGGGGGASVSYYLNLSVSQGSIGGIGYSQMSRVPVFGAGTDTAIASNGYIASFITDAGNPALLEIPAGNWNFETYFSANSGGGSPTFYIELYKVNSGGTATLIASNSGTPESISLGTNINPYFSALAVPTTSLTLTDRLAIRIFVSNSGRTITLHTENSHLCQVITTFTTGLTALNGLTAQVQNFATGSSGTDFAISSATNIHTFNIPTASATNRGLLSSADWTTFNNKQNALTNPVTGTGVNGRVALWNGTNSITSDSDLLFNGTELNISGIKIDGSGIPYIISTTAGNDLFIQFPVGQGISISNNGAEAVARIIKNNLTFYGASNFQTSTGTLTLLSGGGNGNIVLSPNGTGTTTINSSVTASSFIRSGGTSSQFLKADGSVDSNTYLTSAIADSNYVTLATTQTITGAKTFNTTTAEFAAFNSTNANGGTLTFRRNGTNVGHIGNSAVLGGGVLDAIEVRSGIGHSVILKTDSGQLTLASGGGVTLTGALNGTSASFTGNIESTSLSASIVAGRTTGTGYFGNVTGGAYTQVYGDSHSTKPNRIEISGAGGVHVLNAATFSSSVTATSAVIESGGLNIKGTGGIAKPDYLKLSNASAGAFFWDIWRDNTTGNLNFGSAGGGAVSNYVSMQSSGGISFNGDTAAANALDDYEEGTWTPTWSSGGGTLNTNTTFTIGRYTKIGNVVHLWARLYTNSVSSPTGIVTVSGLPFTTNSSPSNGAMHLFTMNAVTGTLTGTPVIFFEPGTSTAKILNKIWNSTEYSGDIGSYFDNDTWGYFHASYFV